MEQISRLPKNFPAAPKIIFYLTGKAIKVYYSRNYVACIFIWAAVFYKGAISWQK